MSTWWRDDKLWWRLLAATVLLGVSAAGFFTFYVTYTGTPVSGLQRAMLALIYVVLFVAKLSVLGWTLWKLYDARSAEDARTLYRLPHIIILTGAVVILGAQAGSLLSP